MSMDMLKKAWVSLRANFWAALVFDAAALLLLLLAIHAWQTRDLPIDEPAPRTVLPMLEGGMASAVREGETGIVYFFAPWCGICRASIGNLDAHVASGRIAWATVVALDYADAAEVRAFIDETGVSLPVLMGNGGTAADWSVPGFPAYFVVAPDGRIASRSIGYSTWLGIWLRSWWAKL